MRVWNIAIANTNNSSKQIIESQIQETHTKSNSEKSIKKKNCPQPPKKKREKKTP